MHKTLLKFLLYELAERFVRLEQLITELSEEADAQTQDVLAILKQQAQQLQQQWLQNRELFLRLYRGAADTDNVAGAAVAPELAKNLDSRVYGYYQSLLSLTYWVNQVFNKQPLPETALFLRSILPAEKLQTQLVTARKPRFILFGPETPEHGLTATPSSISHDSKPSTLLAHHLLIEPLLLVQKNNPLAWLGLFSGLTHELMETSEELRKLKTTGGKGMFADNAFAERVIQALIHLRLLGPAYYFYQVTEALLQPQGPDALFFEKIEPILFFGLNHLNFADKSLVILHEAVEKSRGAFVTEADVGKKSSAAERLVHTDQLRELLQVIERLLPDRLAFTERHFERALRLQQDKLEKNILLSALSLYPLEEVAQKLPDTLSEKGSSGFPTANIYPLLGMMNETPNDPREMITAGWLHKISRAPVWLYSFLESTDPASGAEVSSSGAPAELSLAELPLAQRLSQQDRLLLKSIETAEVHRMLLV